MKSHYDQQEKKLGELTEMTTEPSQRSAALEQDARQPRLAMEADVATDAKTRNRTEDVAADRAINGDSSSANQVDHDQMCLTSFGDDFNGPPALPCTRHGALVDNSAAAPKPCLSLPEMCTRTGTASTATRTTFDKPPFWFCATEEINLRTSN